MNKNLWIILVVIVILIAAGAAYAAYAPEHTDDAMMQKDNGAMMDAHADADVMATTSPDGMMQ